MALNDLLKQEKVEDEGAWLPLPGGGEMHVTYVGNPEFTAKLRRLEKQYRRRNRLRDHKSIPVEDQEELWREALVGTVCKAIREVYETEKAKEPLESTDDNIRMLLESRKIRATVLNYVSDEETFAAENLELVRGN